MQMTSFLKENYSLLWPFKALGNVFDNSVFWMLFSDTSASIQLLKLEIRTQYQFYYADKAETI